MPTFTGGGALRVDWVPNPESIAQSIFSVARYIEDAELPIAVARDILITDVQESFAAERDPVTGMNWRPWARPYPESSQILIKSGALYDKVTDPASYPIAFQSLFIERDAIYQSYGARHQEGSVGLPQRPFIGPSPSATNKIGAVFQGWMANAVAIYERGGGFFIQKRSGGCFGSELSFTPSRGAGTRIL